MQIRVLLYSGVFGLFGAGACFFSDDTVNTSRDEADASLLPNTNGGAADGGNSGDVIVPTGRGVGEACSDEDPCRPNLNCNSDDECEPAGTASAGDDCVISPECEDGLQCVAQQCAPAGDGMLGDGCKADTDCESGLRCSLFGFNAQCVEQGTGDVGAECSVSADCYGGLACAEGACDPVPPGQPPFGLPTWEGETCETPADGPVRAFFEVPGAKDPEGQPGDFFRLPYPNDIRIKKGKLDLKGFPTPGAELLGFDPVQSYVDALEDGESGWGTTPTVFFRFSNHVDLDSLQNSNNNPIRWVNLSNPNQGLAFGWYTTTSRGKYICHDWLGVRLAEGRTLTPGDTYAIMMTTDIQDEDGNTVRASEHFEAMVDNATPDDAALAAAHAAYQPLRDYLADPDIDLSASDLVNAAVFTVADTRSVMSALADTISSEAVPAATDWTLCDDGVDSPCPQADGSRGCEAASADYDEYHALVSLPIFQQGDAPYLMPEDGGNVVTDAPVRTEDVCMSLTVPKGVNAPAGGWPLVVYGHGTGGSFRSHVRDEVAGALAAATASDGSTVNFAVLGYDQVQHGPRRGDSDESPNNLFFNFANPAATRGNPLQGAADVVSIGRFAAALDISAATSGKDAIAIDPARIVFFGHSQGSMHGSLGLPYADEYRATVLSGNGASLTHSLLTKTQPVNIAAAVPFVLQDFDANGQLPPSGSQAMHPVLGLLQHWIDPADPLNFGAQMGKTPEAGHNAKSLFMTYGLDDSYSPPKTMELYALVADVVVAEAQTATPDEIGSKSEVSVPVFGTHNDVFTLALRQYDPAKGSDGHFVVFDIQEANDDATRFLADAVGDPANAPHVGAN